LNFDYSYWVMAVRLLSSCWVLNDWVRQRWVFLKEHFGLQSSSLLIWVKADLVANLKDCCCGSRRRLIVVELLVQGPALKPVVLPQKSRLIFCCFRLYLQKQARQKG
jgi:hypothetical protein